MKHDGCTGRLKNNLLVVCVVAGMSLMTADCIAKGAKPPEQKKALREYKEHLKGIDAALEKAKQENAEAEKKVDPERVSQASRELQKTSVEVGVKASVRAIDQASKPANDRNSVKNTVQSIKDVKKLGDAKSEELKALMDIADPDSDAQKHARETREAVRGLEKEKKATESTIKSLEKSIKQAERRSGRNPSSRDNSGPLEIRSRQEGGKDFPDKVRDPREPNTMKA